MIITQNSDITTRAIKYLEKMPESISGQGGHNALFAAVNALYNGFALDEETTFDLIIGYFNPRCEPQWNEAEIRHKIADAVKKGGNRGYLLENKPPKENKPVNHSRFDFNNIVAEYVYADANGLPTYWILRDAQKNFMPKRWDAKQNKFVYNLKGVTRVPYNLPTNSQVTCVPTG